MDLKVFDGTDVRLLPVTEGQTVLQALAGAGSHVNAPCGGAGTCRKCTMLISDATGTSHRLACQVQVASGMSVTLPKAQEMSVSLAGSTRTWPADGEPGTYGLAFDIGTTTVVARLHDLEDGRLLGSLGCANPQLPFGADVLSRISQCRSGALPAMQGLIGERLALMAQQLLEESAISADRVAASVVAGNTTMLHIAAGLDPTPIGVAPFTPRSLFGKEIEVESLRRAGLCEGRALFAPCVAGYVGADIACGILACGMGQTEENVLLLDLGTNGEIALATPQGISTCATAAGPVFEGANIAFGMPAYPGAISRATLSEAGDLELAVMGGVEPIGICGTGLFDLVALLLKEGIVDETGRLLERDELEEGTSPVLARRICEHEGMLAFRIAGSIQLTQKDVRNIQLAKAAICAGIETMLECASLGPEDITRLAIAGGFGQHLSLASAATVGIFPAGLESVALSVGNTAIEGASALLLSEDARARCRALMERSGYVELSGNALFNERYVEDMMFEQ